MTNRREPRRILSEVVLSVATSAGAGLANRIQEDQMLIDCESCTMREIACSDCVIGVLLASPPHAVITEPLLVPRAEPVEFSGDEAAAVAALSQSGLIPPLRMVRPA